jgi:hypothetical protein
VKTQITCLLLTCLAVSLTGCTAIGIGVGKMVDNSNAQFHRVSWSDTRSVPSGREVQVTLTSGDTLSGQFKGLRSLPPDSYRYLYESARVRVSGDSVLPRLGEFVSVFGESGPRVGGVFRGIEAEALALRRSDDESISYLRLSNAAQLQGSHGESYDLTRLRALASARALPSDREFTLESAGQTRRIPLEQIQEVYAPPQTTHNWVLGGFIGLAIDIAVLAFVIPSINFDLAPDINMTSSGTGYGGY